MDTSILDRIAEVANQSLIPRQLTEEEKLNCLSHWFPILHKAGLPVPRTQIIDAPSDLIKIIDHEEPKDYKMFIEALALAGHEVGYPCFLRTGHTSAKHYWKDTCYIEKPGDFPSHVYGLIEFSECADLSGLPYNVFAVRELLPTVPVFKAFLGAMPIVKEFRCFFSDGKIDCIHPYWPESSIKQASDENWPQHLLHIGLLTHREINELIAITHKIAQHFSNGYSVDILWTAKGWYVTDMALAHTSYHWPSCPNRRL